MRLVGITLLKNKLSEYFRLAAGGETVLVTDRYRVVAENRSRCGRSRRQITLVRSPRIGEALGRRPQTRRRFKAEVDCRSRVYRLCGGQRR